MKDFDATPLREERPETDRTFNLAGRRFVLIDSPPFTAMFPQADIQPNTNLGVDLKALNELIIGLLETDYRDEWAKLVEGPDCPTIDTLVDISTWCVETVAARPTGRSSDSRRGRGMTETNSTASSSSRGDRTGSLD